MRNDSPDDDHFQSPSMQSSQQSHGILVSKHLMPPPLSLLPKQIKHTPKSLLPMLPLPNFIGIIPNFQPLDRPLESFEKQQQDFLYTWIGQAFPNIIYRKYEDLSYCKIDNLDENWNIWAYDINRFQKLQQEQTFLQIKPYYEPINSEDHTLIFESRFESGNLSCVSKTDTNQYNLLLQNDINTTGYAQWFFFKVSNTHQNTTVRFNILNFYKHNSLYRQGMKIIIYSRKQSKNKNLSWHRGGDCIQYYQNCYSKSNVSCKPYYTLTWLYTFQYDNDEIYFAYNYPYTYTNLQHNLQIIEAEMPNIFYRQLLCRTIASNRVDVITITEQHPFELHVKKSFIVITARIHPGQTVSSYVCNGIMQFLLSQHDEAKKLRKYFIFKIIPMLNPDGVIHGNYRSNISGYDLNKKWQHPSKLHHAQIYYLKLMISKLQQQADIVLFCDLHGHSMKKNAFVYGCHDYLAPTNGKYLPYVLSKLFKGFSYTDCNFIVKQQQLQTNSRTVLYKLLKHCHIYALESSFCGPYYQNIHFTVQHFQDLGKKFCQAILIQFSDQIRNMQIDAVMNTDDSFINHSDTFEYYRNDSINMLDYANQIDSVIHKNNTWQNSQGSEPELEQQTLLQDRTIKKFLLRRNTRNSSPTTKHFTMTRKSISKDLTNKFRINEHPYEIHKSTSPLKKILNESPIKISRPNLHIKLSSEKKPIMQKIELKVFEPLNIIPDKIKIHKIKNKVPVTERITKYDEWVATKIHKNHKIEKQMQQKKQEQKVQNKINVLHEDAQLGMFRNNSLKGYIKGGRQNEKKSNQFVIRKNQLLRGETASASNLFKSVLSSLRKNKKK